MQSWLANCWGQEEEGKEEKEGKREGKKKRSAEKV